MSKPKPDAVEDTSPATPTETGNALQELTSGSAGTLILLVLVFACYAWSTQGAYLWQDDVYVTGNPTLRSFAGLSRIWTDFSATPQYYPMTFTSFWLEVQAFGLTPKLSHVINAALHALSVLLLWKILRRLAVPGAWVAAAIFAVHPIHVESVVWITERKNTLSLVFGLSALLMYLRYAKLGHEEQTEPAGEGINVALPDDPTRLYRLFLALFVLALLSKTTLAVLPAIIVVIIWWQRGRLTKNDWLSLLPALALGAIGGALTTYLEHSPQYVGASGVEWQLGIPERIQLAGQTAVFYAYKLLWPFPIGYGGKGVAWPPFPISFNYERWTPDAANALLWLPLAGVIGTLGVLLALRNRIGRGPLAAIAIFLIGLLPASGLIIALPMRYSWVADHFAYVGSIGLIVGVAAVAARAFGRKPEIGAVVACVLLLGLAAVTFWHSTAFKNQQTLWYRTWSKNPKSWLAAVSYGEVAKEKANADYVRLMKEGDDEAAEKERQKTRDAARVWFKTALKLNPDAYEAHTALGTLATQEQKFDEALTHLKQAQASAEKLQVSRYNGPTFLIGELLIAQGKTEEGLKVFTDLEDLESTLGRRSGSLLAQVRTRHGDVLLESIKSPIQPEMPQAERDILNEVINQYTTATELNPDYVLPKVKLAALLTETGFYPQALQQLNETFRIDKDNTDAKFLTAVIAQKQGQYDAAAAQLKNLIAVQPNLLPPRIELAKVLLAAGQVDEAIAELEKTIQEFPRARLPREMLAEIKAQAATRPAQSKLLP